MSNIQVVLPLLVTQFSLWVLYHHDAYSYLVYEGF